MNKKRYLANKEWFKSHGTALKLLEIMYRVLPLVMVLVYPMLIVIKGFMGVDHQLLRMIYIPLIVLIEITVLRKLINRPRPYEAYDTAPVVKRDGKGCSFPSRHTGSAFIIAMSAIPVSPIAAIVLIAVAAIIGLTRIFSGVHYISDVLMGAGLAVVTGLIFLI